MTGLAANQFPDQDTSAGYAAFFWRVRVPAENPAGEPVVVGIGGFWEPETGTSYDLPRSVERTTSGFASQVEHARAGTTTAEAILEIRRRSGLTWEELSELFEVSRRSVHHWANGKTVSAKHDREIRGVLAAIRHIDEGSQAATRGRLLTTHASEKSVFALLQARRFDEVMTQTGGAAVPAPQRLPLSQQAQERRRPPAPALLLEAKQDRPNFPVSKARIARAARTTKKST